MVDHWKPCLHCRTRNGWKGWVRNQVLSIHIFGANTAIHLWPCNCRAGRWSNWSVVWWMVQWHSSVGLLLLLLHQQYMDIGAKPDCGTSLAWNGSVWGNCVCVWWPEQWTHGAWAQLSGDAQWLNVGCVAVWNVNTYGGGFDKVYLDFCTILPHSPSGMQASVHSNQLCCQTTSWQTQWLNRVWMQQCGCSLLSASLHWPQLELGFYCGNAARK